MSNRFSVQRTGWLGPAVLVLMGSAAFAAAPGVPALSQSGGNANPGVSPVQARANGLSYGEWSARWWQWFFSLPLDGSPLFGTADCSVGQSGHVWFLGGAPSPKPACSVPAGTALFVAIIDAECSTLPGDNSGDLSEAGLRGCAGALANLVDTASLSATLDGVPITGLARYRVQSPLFSIGPLPGPANNNLGFYFTGNPTPAGTMGQSVADGYFLLLNPLPPGEHVLHFHGEIPAYSFVVDMTYALTVTP